MKENSEKEVPAEESGKMEEITTAVNDIDTDDGKGQSAEVDVPEKAADADPEEVTVPTGGDNLEE